MFNRLRLTVEVFSIAITRFLVHDAWAIASHIALSVLTSLFPFLILMTALASLFGAGSLANAATDLILEAWPREVAEPIAGEIHTILTGRRSDVLTLGLVLALYFSSSAVEALRMGLNRAYGVRETRAWWLTRLESIAFVIGGAFIMLVLAFLVVLGPFVWRAVLYWVPALRYLDGLIDFLRIGIATVVIVAGPADRLQICALGAAKLVVDPARRLHDALPVAPRADSDSAGISSSIRAPMRRPTGVSRPPWWRWSSSTPWERSFFSAANSTAPSCWPSAGGPLWSRRRSRSSRRSTLPPL